MKKINISIEHCFRYLENSIKNDSFLTFQIPFSHNITGKEAEFSIFHIMKNKSIGIFTQKFIVKKEYIQFFNSHEDPIVSDKEFIYLSLHIPLTILPEQIHQLKIIVNGLEKEETEYILDGSMLGNQHRQISKISDDGHSISSRKDCNLTFHLGDCNAVYKEETFKLLKGDSFNFQHYISNYEYIGVQCSYEDLYPEIEEKHIIKGQKGIYQTAILTDNDLIVAEGLIPFNHKYLNKIDVSNNKFHEVKNLKELMLYHETNPIKVFQTSIEFIEPTYRAKNTYSQANLYTKQKIKKQSHLDLAICKECDLSCECIQVIPSGLSHSLMIKRISTQNNQECEIYQMINNKKA